MSERAIFRFDRNGQAAYADPLEIRCRLDAFLGGNYRRVLADTKSNDPGRAIPAYEKLAGAVCAAFKLGRPFDESTGQGVLRETWLTVLRQYVTWEESKKNSTVSTATLPPRTGSAF